MLKILRCLPFVINCIIICTAQNSEFGKIPGKASDLKKPLALCRIYENDEIENRQVASDNDYIFLSSMNGKIFSIEKNGNNIKWQTDLGGKIILEPYISNNKLIVLSANNNADDVLFVLRTLDKENGLVRWQTNIKIKSRIQPSNSSIVGDQNELPTVFATGGIIILSLNNGIFLINSQNGNIISQKNVEETVSSKLFYTENQIVFGTVDKSIHILSSKNLEEINKIKVSSVPYAVRLSQNRLIWTDDRGNLFATLNVYDSPKEKRLFRAGGRILSINAFDENCLLTSLDNFLYFISVETGEVLWKKRLAARPENEPTIFEDYVLIQTVGDLSAWIIELKSGNLANRIDLSEDNLFIGNITNAFPYILFQTEKGILFYASKEYCGGK